MTSQIALALILVGALTAYGAFATVRAARIPFERDEIMLYLFLTAIMGTLFVAVLQEALK